MSGAYANVVNSAVGRRFAAQLGLPRPVKLRRYAVGQPLIDGPVLVMAGEDDERYAAIAARTAAAIGPNATAALVPGAGHSAHLEQPERFAALVLGWLDRL